MKSHPVFSYVYKQIKNNSRQPFLPTATDCNCATVDVKDNLCEIALDTETHFYIFFKNDTCYE